ncbi:galanin peptides-like isoform X2 [Osmerus eperlanus]|uniref:galanin peptides-like isoform X2 n=1 Tax=Osmerus eperlanus TaxID=29151 RepID=UPI002E0F071C
MFLHLQMQSSYAVVCISILLSGQLAACRGITHMEKRGWTLNSAGYLLGPYTHRTLTVRHGALLGKREDRVTRHRSNDLEMGALQDRHGHLEMGALQDRHGHLEMGALQDRHGHLEMGALQDRHGHLEMGALQDRHGHLEMGALQDWHGHLEMGALQDRHGHLQPK